MARPAQQRGRGGLVLRAVAVLLMALLSLCLVARVDAVAAAAGASAAGPGWKKGVAAEEVVTEQAAGGDEAEEQAPERVAMEVVNDYGPPNANSRHVPHP